MNDIEVEVDIQSSFIAALFYMMIKNGYFVAIERETLLRAVEMCRQSCL